MMLSFFKRGAFVLAATTLCVLAFGASPAVPDAGLQNVNLSCSDGTNLGLTLSTADVTSLTNAVTAMSLFPAGLTCGVSTQADPPSGGNPKSDYAVGGGDQFDFPSPTAACRHNFGFSAHTPDDKPTSAKGTFNETVPGGCAGFGDTGQLRVDIDCLYVNGNHADMHGKVKKATGQFANDGFFQDGDAFISTTDDDLAGNDTLGAAPAANTGSTGACGGQVTESIVMNGNISVHDA
jgi:hypothetical protein